MLIREDMPYLIPLVDKVLTGQIIVDDSLRQVPFGEPGPLGLAKYVEAEESLEGFLKGWSAKGGMTVDPDVSSQRSDEEDEQPGPYILTPER